MKYEKVIRQEQAELSETEAFQIPMSLANQILDHVNLAGKLRSTQP